MKELNVNTENQIALRTHLEKFVTLTDQEFEMALSYFTFHHIKKNTILIQPGEPVHYTYWVVDGLLISYLNDDAGKELVMQFALANCWITDQDGYYNQGLAQLRIEAFEDSEVYSLSFQDREKMCTAVPSISHFFRRKANDSFVKQQKRLITYMTSDAQTRFDQLMLEYPSLYQRVPKLILAAYLGVTRETLSRFKRK